MKILRFVPAPICTADGSPPPRIPQLVSPPEPASCLDLIGVPARSGGPCATPELFDAAAIDRALFALSSENAPAPVESFLRLQTVLIELGAMQAAVARELRAIRSLSREERRRQIDPRSAVSAAEARAARLFSSVAETQRRVQAGLEALRAGSSSDVAREAISAELLRARIAETITYADIFSAVGDQRSASRELDGASKLLFEGLGTEERNIDTAGLERGGFASTFVRDTRVEFLEERALDQAAARLASLPLDTLATLVLHAGSRDSSRSNVLRQALDHLASKLPAGEDAPPIAHAWRALAGLAESNYLAAISKGEEATIGRAVDRLAEAIEDAGRLPEPMRKTLRQELAVQMASTLAGMADSSGGDRAVNRLQALRGQIAREQPPFDDAVLAQLALLHATAAVHAGKQREGIAVIEELVEKYSAVPFVASAAAEFRRSNYQGRGEARLKTLWHELGRETMGEALVAGGGGALIGGGIGWALGGPAGGAAGLVIGGAIGTAALKGINLYRGWDRIREAGATGYTHLTWGDFALDSAALAIDLVSVLAPVRGGAALGGQGLKALFAAEASALRKNLAEGLGNIAAGAGKNLSAAELETMVRDLLLRRFARAGADFGGGGAMALAVTAAAAPIAAGLYEIETSDLSPEEKERARAELFDAVGPMLLSAGMTTLALRTGQQLAARPSGPLQLDAAVENRLFAGALYRPHVAAGLWEPAVRYVPNPEGDHNGAFLESDLVRPALHRWLNQAPSWLGGPKRIISDVPLPANVAPAQLDVSIGGKPVKVRLAATAILEGHGYRLGIAGASNAELAEMICEDILARNQKLPAGRRIKFLILDSCQQGDLRLDGTGRTNAQAFQEAIDAALRRRGIDPAQDPISVLASDHPGVLYSGRVVTRDADAAELAIDPRKKRVPARFVLAADQEPRLQFETAELIAGGALLVYAGAGSAAALERLLSTEE